MGDSNLSEYLAGLKVPERSDSVEDNESADNHVDETQVSTQQSSQVKEIDALRSNLNEMHERQLNQREDRSLDPVERASAAMKAGATNAYIRYLDDLKERSSNVDSDNTNATLSMIRSVADNMDKSNLNECYHGLDTPQQQLETAKDTYDKVRSFI